jgi:hypothetical protein
MHDLPSQSSVAVTIPASAAYLRHVRVLTATVADDLGFDIDAIEALRVAVDELCALAMSDVDDGGGTLTLVIEADAEALVLNGRCGPTSADPEVDPIAEQLLRAGTTSYELRRDGDECVLGLRADRSTNGADGH